MAEACPGLTYEKLCWTADWHIREETYAKALAEIVNLQHRLPMAEQWGDGSTSSSDGQAFPIAMRRPVIAQTNAKYGRDPVVTFYTHISDRYAPFHTKAISSTVRDAPHVLDGLLGHDTDLRIREHYTDTAGFTDQVFAACTLLGFRFAPRIRDLGDQRIYTLNRPKQYPTLLPLIGGRIQARKIEQSWDEILRLASSIRMGTVTASLILGKLASYPRQNGLAQALRELGRIERTLFTLDWIQNPDLRQRATIGLNKGEARNTLARAVFFHRRGAVRDRLREDLQNKASGLNLAVAAIILWNTVYLQKAVQMLADEGTPVPPECMPHLSPLGWEHINMTAITSGACSGSQRSRNCARFAGIGYRPREPYRTARRPLETQAVLSVHFSPFGAAWPLPPQCRQPVGTCLEGPQTGGAGGRPHPLVGPLRHQGPDPGAFDTGDAAHPGAGRSARLA